MSMIPKAMVLTAPGINCDQETARMFEMAGAAPNFVHITDWVEGKASLSDYQLLALPGGFSYGDDIAAGRILGVKLRSNNRLSHELNQFLDDGKFGISICNGFQIAVETGLLPAGSVEKNRDQTVALAGNLSGVFDDRWGRLRVEDSVCKFVSKELLGEIIELPWAHAEGRFLRDSDESYRELNNSGQVVFRYARPDGFPAEEAPYNPNGSPFGIAGITDPSGQFLGLMPHPERFVDKMQHPDVRRRDVGPASGLLIARAMVELASA